MLLVFLETYRCARLNVCVFVCNYLCYMNELGEDLCSLLWGVSVEDHELDPLGDSVAQHDRALERRIIPH